MKHIHQFFRGLKLILSMVFWPAVIALAAVLTLLPPALAAEYENPLYLLIYTPIFLYGVYYVGKEEE